MMGIGPTEAAGMDFWTYQALLWNWNAEHSQDRDAPPLTADKVNRLQAAMAAHSVH